MFPTSLTKLRGLLFIALFFVAACETDTEAVTNDDLYWMGRTRNISAQLCQQIREEAQDACGCLAAELT